MKRLGTACLLFLLWYTASAQPGTFSKTYKAGSRLYVFTRSGLTLRTKPDISGEAVMVLPYGTELVVQPDPKPAVTFTNSNIKGAWVKVKAGSKQGYVFDGFLSRLPPISESNEPRYTSDLTDYLRKLYPVAYETTERPDSNYYDYEEIQFNNGIVFKSMGGDGGSSMVLVVPSSVLTFKEVFLLARLAFPEFFGDKPCPYQESDVYCDFVENLSLAIKLRDNNRVELIWGHAD